jgi:hypothetical protein
MFYFAIIVSALSASVYVFGPYLTICGLAAVYLCAKGCTWMVRLAPIVLVLASGCGTDRLTPDYWTDLGIGVAVTEDAADWAHAPDLRDRIDAIAVIVAEHASRSPEELSGLVILFHSGPVLCHTDTPFWTIGCHYTHSWIEVSTHQDPDDDSPEAIEAFGDSIWNPGCVEQTALAHELLHELIGNPEHDDPLWLTLPGLFDDCA